jgi:uncharacterized protein YbjT (DUF2867 family)
MRIVVIGGTGLIGSKLVSRLRKLDHEVIAASPASGVNTITGEGLTEVMKGTDVVVDLANSPSFEDKAVLEFFQTAGHNLLAAEVKAGVKHHIALSIVGTDRLDNGYFRGKVAQENIIKQSGVPYSIVHSTQFFEFLGAIAASGTEDNVIHLSTAAFQPIAADDVAAVLADVAVAAPLNGTIEIAGPERGRFVDIVKRYLTKMGDTHKVVEDVHAKYFGSELNDQSIVPGENPRLGKINFETWFSGQLQKA